MLIWHDSSEEVYDEVEVDSEIGDVSKVCWSHVLASQGLHLLDFVSSEVEGTENHDGDSCVISKLQLELIEILTLEALPRRSQVPNSSDKVRQEGNESVSDEVLLLVSVEVLNECPEKLGVKD